MMAANRGVCVSVLDQFRDLHLSLKDGEYVGMLEGTRVVKEEIANDNIRYFEPGDVIEDVPGAEGLKFYVLVRLWQEIKVEGSGVADETYAHNKELAKNDALAAALSSIDNANRDVYPFDTVYTVDQHELKDRYEQVDAEWRRIDYDWLYSAGNLALRVNSITNNLSLAIAIELNPSKKSCFFLATPSLPVGLAGIASIGRQQGCIAKNT